MSTAEQPVPGEGKSSAPTLGQPSTPTKGKSSAHRATPARRLALRLTSQLRQRRAYAAYLIDQQLRSQDLPQAERDFSELLVLGVAASWGALDELLDRALPGPHLQPQLRDALRLSVYELVYLHKEPHVAVSQGVELARSVAPRASGLANRALRNIAGYMQTDWQQGGFPFANPASDTTALALQQAFPPWLAQRLIDDLGRPAAQQFMAASNLPAPNTVFALPEASAAGASLVGDTASCWPPLAMDAAAQAVCRLARPPAGQPFLEVGAGRGGKTIALQLLAQQAGSAPQPHIALELHASTARQLRQRLGAYPVQNLRVITGDVLELAALTRKHRLPESYAAALIDAPCSNTGTLRRHPEARWRLTPAQVSQLAAQGLAMLLAVAARIAPGGFLVYSSCSVLAEENEQVIANFLAAVGNSTSGHWQLVPYAADCPYLRTQLIPGSADAHFAAKLQRLS